MNTNFTNGPWQRSGVRIKLGAEDCIRVGPDGFPIAFIPIGKTHEQHAGAIADANLIAAAPTLLDALEAVQLAPLFSALDAATQNAVRAAIAKAGGAT
jgi:hypothetical protein